MEQQQTHFRNQVVIVTGAACGIGAATATAFARAGARVALTGLAGDAAIMRAQATQLSAAGCACTVIPADVTDNTQVTNMVAQVVQQWGRIDVLVNNAGLGYHGPFETMSLDDFETVMQVNLLGVARCLHAVVPIMIRQRSGQIINIASAHGRRAHPRYAAYSASKFALCGLADSLRVELAPHGIGVLTFCPPYTETAFFDNVLHSVAPIRPRRRGATAEQVAARILDAARGRKREVVVTLRERLLLWGNKFAPGLIDSLIARRYENKLRNHR